MPVASFSPSRERLPGNEVDGGRGKQRDRILMTSFELLDPAMPEDYFISEQISSFLSLFKLLLELLLPTEERVLIINLLNKFLMTGLS